MVVFLVLLKWLGLAILASLLTFFLAFLSLVMVEISICLLRKTPWGVRHLKPRTSLGAPYDDRHSTENGCEEANIANCIKSSVRQLLLLWCPIKREPNDTQPIQHRKDDAKERREQDTYSDSPNMVDQLVDHKTEGIPQHSGANVSQVNGAYQPKQRRTLETPGARANRGDGAVVTISPVPARTDMPCPRSLSTER